MRIIYFALFLFTTSASANRINAKEGGSAAAFVTGTTSAGKFGLDVNVLNTSSASGLTDTQLRATAVPVSGTVTCSGVSGGLTDTQLRLTAVPVSLASAPTTPVTGTFWQTTQPVSIASMPTTAVTLATAPTTPVTGTFWQNTQPVSIASLPALAIGANAIGSITNTSFTATQGTGTNLHTVIDSGAVTATLPAETTKVIGTVNVSAGQTIATTGPLTDTQLRLTPVPVSGTVSTGGLTDTQLRATPVPVSGTVATGGLTDTQIRATALPISGTVTVTQGTGTNLHVVNDAGSAVIGHVIVDTASTTAVTQATGTNLHAVIDSGSTTAVTGNVAGTVADGANVVLGAKADAKSTATDTTAVTIMSVLKQISASAQAPPSQAVTNAGTFATQSTLAAETTKVIGTVNISAAQGIAINDGTNLAKVTAASAAAAAADKALVVAQSPNGGNPCANSAATLVSITGATAGTAAVQIIALSGTTKIYICSMTIIGVSGTSPTFSLVQGTGSNCATGQTVVKQAWATAAGTLYSYAPPVAVGAAGAALCYLDTGTSPVQNYQLTYVQQ